MPNTDPNEEERLQHEDMLSRSVANIAAVVGGPIVLVFGSQTAKGREYIRMIGVNVSAAIARAIIKECARDGETAEEAEAFDAE
jgi:hypothetical protein